MEQKQINDRVDDVVDNAGQPAALISRVLINFVIPLPTAFYGVDISPSDRKAILALPVTHTPSEKDTRSIQVIFRALFSLGIFGLIFCRFCVDWCGRTSTTSFTATACGVWYDAPSVSIIVTEMEC